MEGGLCTVDSERVIGFSHPSVSRVIEIGCICNNAVLSDGVLIGQPTEGALLVLGMKVCSFICLFLFLVCKYLNDFFFELRKVFFAITRISTP